MRTPTIIWLSLSAALLLAGPALSQVPDAEPLPPPDIDDAPAQEVAPADPPGAGSDELPPKIPPPPGTEPPEVTIRTDAQTGDVVEEYRQGGQVYMVVVRPPVGPAYRLLDTNGDGRLDSNDAEGPVHPVYWTIYEWN
ncbi:MAG TPA: DUF2782 domain-containing protein [Xanthomonadaceae bacterium]|nr:DUF2782 domain-containing protein [Xanthomonadaceae bacterium]